MQHIIIFSFSAVNGSKLFLSCKISIQSIRHSIGRHWGTWSASFVHAQKGIMQQSKHNCDKDFPILYQSLAENVIFTDNRNSFSLILIRMKAAVPIKSDLIRRIESSLSWYISWYYTCFFFIWIIRRFYNMLFQIVLAFKVNSVV